MRTTGTPQPKYHVPERVDALLRRFGRYEEDADADGRLAEAPARHVRSDSARSSLASPWPPGRAGDRRGPDTVGDGQLRVASKSGTNQLVLGATRGGAVITLSDNPNIARVVLYGGAEGGSLALYDEAGETVWYADSGSSQGIASAPEDKRAGLKQGPEEIRTAGPRPPSDDAARPTIRSKCAEEWGDDFEMQKYCQDKQFEALANLRARNMASGAYATIRKKCSEEWGADYKMLLYCEEKQVEAYSELNR